MGRSFLCVREGDVGEVGEDRDDEVKGEDGNGSREDVGEVGQERCASRRRC